jgi:cyanate permease
MTPSGNRIFRSPRALVLTLILGAASAGLYFLLFLFADELTELAGANRDGQHRLYAFIPLAVALVFSLVHGAFTGHFWDLLGFRARK